MDDKTTSAAATPERAGREGDQPLPVAGQVDVLADLARTLPGELLARREVGIRRYGRPLETHNGRDVHRDLEDELLDAAAYARQAKLQHADLLAELARVRGELDNTREALAVEVAARRQLEERIGLGGG